MTAIYYTEPNTIDYMELPDGRADVWLRKDITETVDGEENTCWECEEVSFRTNLTQEEIEENFDEIFENGAPIVDEETQEEVADGITLAERVEALEEAVLYLASKE